MGFPKKEAAGHDVRMSRLEDRDAILDNFAWELALTKARTVESVSNVLALTRIQWTDRLTQAVRLRCIEITGGKRCILWRGHPIIHPQEVYQAIQEIMRESKKEAA